MIKDKRENLPEARRAIVSALSKSEKTLTKLKIGTWQHTMTAGNINALGIALSLIDQEAGAGTGCDYAEDKLHAAVQSISVAKSRVEKALPKFKPGTSQHTLALRRIEAFRIAEELIQQEIRDIYLAKATVGERTALNNTIKLCEYDPGWPTLFEAEAEGLRAALGDKALQIEHVGSTSVPGLCAKPIIDMLLIVADSSDEATYLSVLETAGYMLRIREPEWFEHRMLKGPGADINLHVFSYGASEAGRMLAFRDWLRVNGEDRNLYADTKRQLAGREWKHVQNYADAKTAVVQEIVTRSLAGVEPEFKKASPADIPTLKTLAREVIQHNYIPFLGQAAVKDFIGSGASDAEIEDGLENCVAMMEYGGIIGFSITNGDVLHLLMVSVDHQKQGYGAKLLAYTEAALFTEFEKIYLQSFTGNDAANSFYETQGWLLSKGRVPDDSGISTVCFEKHKG